MLSRAALESRPTITTLVYCYSGLVQVVSVSCHRWRLAGDISHKPLRLRCAPDYIHRWRRSRALETQIATSPDAIPSLIRSRQFSFLSKLHYIFFYDVIKWLCLDALALCAVYCEPMQSQWSDFLLSCPLLRPFLGQKAASQELTFSPHNPCDKGFARTAKAKPWYAAAPL